MGGRLDQQKRYSSKDLKMIQLILQTILIAPLQYYSYLVT